jgi:malonyl-CoA decarboxylase
LRVKPNNTAKLANVSVIGSSVAIENIVPEAAIKLRSTGERLAARISKSGEALSPRELRRILEELQATIDPRVSEIEGGRRAMAMAAWYAATTLAQRHDCWLLISEQFMADPSKARAAQEKYALAVGTPDEAVAQVRLRQSTVSPRRKLLQRFSAFPAGIRFLVDMRADMLPALKIDKRLQALDVEMEYMFSTWFDVGFLELKRISWDSPASMLEKLIQYEAVHDIKSWADLKNRLDSDRRCYGFFHPRLPDEPLIFVEVAFLDAISDCITPLLDESAAAIDLRKATTAIFYSISNTQSGLKGVSFGDSLIKRVVETLKEDFPRLKTFATLSPIPGYRAWLQRTSSALAAQAGEVDVLALKEKAPLRKALQQSAAQYLGQQWHEGKPLDAVARFHLGNGARIERINWAGDPSGKGIKQSYGLMVNYLYDLRKLDKHREMLANGKIPMAGDVEKLV